MLLDPAACASTKATHLTAVPARLCTTNARELWPLGTRSTTRVRGGAKATLRPAHRAAALVMRPIAVTVSSDNARSAGSGRIASDTHRASEAQRGHGNRRSVYARACQEFKGERSRYTRLHNLSRCLPRKAPPHPPELQIGLGLFQLRTDPSKARRRGKVWQQRYKYFYTQWQACNSFLRAPCIAEGPREPRQLRSKNQWRCRSLQYQPPTPPIFPPR